MEQTWVNKIKESALGIAETTAKGFHAIPKPNADTLKEMPSLHRLMNVVGMVGGFASAQYLSNIIFGCKINGSQCEEIPKEKVPAPLRFLHGIVKYDPFSDDTRDQYLKVLHQMIPAVAGAAGAVKGSEIFFKDINMRERKYEEWMTPGKKLNPLEADAAAAFKQGKAWRVIAGSTAWLSSASGLTALYGVALNAAFMLCNGGKVAGFKGLRTLTGNTSDLGVGAQRGLEEVLKGTEMALRDNSAEKFAHQLVNGAIKPLVKMTDQQEKEIVKELVTAFEGNAAQLSKGLKPEDAKKEMDRFRKLMNDEVMEVIASTEIGRLKIGENGVLSSIVKKIPSVKSDLADIHNRIKEQPLVKRAPSRLTLQMAPGDTTDAIIGAMHNAMHENDAKTFAKQVVKHGIVKINAMTPDAENALVEHFTPLFESGALKSHADLPKLIEAVRRQTMNALYDTPLEKTAVIEDAEKRFPGLAAKIQEVPALLDAQRDLFGSHPPISPGRS